MIIKSKIDNLQIIGLNGLKFVGKNEVVEVPLHIYKQYMYSQGVECLSHKSDGSYIRYIVESKRDIKLHIGSDVKELKKGDKILLTESEARTYIQLGYVKGSTDKYILAGEPPVEAEVETPVEAEVEDTKIVSTENNKKNINSNKSNKKK